MQCSVKLYHLKHFGYFKPHSQESEFGDPVDLMNDFIKWQKDKEIGRTTTGKVENTGFMPIYLYGAEAVQMGHCVVLWNSVSGDSGSYKLLSTEKKTGEDAIETKRHGINQIPGFPGYFWIDAERRLVGVLQFKGRRSSITALSNYMESFLALHSKHVNSTGDSLGEVVINSYDSGDGKSFDPNDITFRFNTQLIDQDAQIDVLRKRRTEITSVIRKEHLDYNITRDKSIIKALYRRYGKDAINEFASTHTESVKFKSELSICPTEVEFEGMLTAAKKFAKGSKKDKWSNIGVYFGHHDGPHWLAKIAAELNIEVDAQSGAMGVFNPDALAFGVNQRASKFRDVISDYIARIEKSKKKKRKKKSSKKKRSTNKKDSSKSRSTP